MTDHTRYGIYYLPPAGGFARAGAAWLGWDIAHGAAVAQPPVDGIAGITAGPQKYGFHATLKPPFRLAKGCTPGDLGAATRDLAARTAPAACDGLELTVLGRFLALTPRGDAGGISRVAAACVTGLDGFRAPPDPAELARRRQAGLGPAQEAMLVRWGYPHVLDCFRFHMTLTGRLAKADIAGVAAQVRAHLPALSAPFRLDRIALVGERPDGRFEEISRHDLRGGNPGDGP